MVMNDEITIAINIVQAFHDKLNAKDATGVLALATEDARISGPRGTGEGKQLLEEWVGRASITMELQRWFHTEGTVIVEQIARWHAPDTGEETSSRRVSTVFGIRDGSIASIARYDTIGEAVTSAGMDESHEITPSDPVPSS